MRVVVNYPVPFDAWDTFKPFVKRFTDTFREFPPGCDYVLYASCIWGEPSDEVRQWFYGIKTRFVTYNDGGCDIGSAQQVAKLFANETVLTVNMTSRCYLHRKGWLARYVEAAQKHGTALYGASCSNEGGKLHVCTRAYALPAPLFSEYPYLIDTREKGQLCEVGDWCLTEWVWRSQGLPCYQVTWDNERHIDSARDPSELGIYRRGSQTAMLVFDRHTDLYRDADSKEKERLTAICDGDYKHFNDKVTA